MGRPWDHRDLEASKGTDAQTCDGTNQNLNYAGEGDTEFRMQLADLPGYSIRIDQEGEVCKPGEGIQGR